MAFSCLRSLRSCGALVGARVLGRYSSFRLARCAVGTYIISLVSSGSRLGPIFACLPEAAALKSRHCRLVHARMEYFVSDIDCADDGDARVVAAQECDPRTDADTDGSAYVCCCRPAFERDR